MAILKTTEEILKGPWHLDTLPEEPTPTEFWHYIREMDISDVKAWEEIYYQPGNVGIYAAWAPYSEFYIIVYDLLPHTTIEKFYGANASEKVQKRAIQLGITLPSINVWVDPQNTWLTTTLTKT